MFKLLKDSFRIANDCIILVAPLIIFVSLSMCYMSYATNSVDDAGKLIFAGFTIFIMTSGFLAAWLYMAKKTVKLSKRIFLFDSDRNKALKDLLLTLPKGIGKLLLPMMGVISLYSLIYIILFSIIGFFTTKITGGIDFDSLDLSTILITTKELFVLIKDFVQNNLVALKYWITFSILAITIVSFLTMLWIPEIIYNEKNSFKALFNAIKKIFSNFWKCLLLFCYITCIIVLVSVLNTILLFNPFFYFIVLTLLYYFIVYIIVLLFSYYEQTYKND